MGTPIVKGLTEVHHCATYSPPRPIYGLCRVGQPFRPILRCDLLPGNYGTVILTNNTRPEKDILDFMGDCFTRLISFIGVPGFPNALFAS